MPSEQENKDGTEIAGTGRNQSREMVKLTTGRNMYFLNKTALDTVFIKINNETTLS